MFYLHNLMIPSLEQLNNPLTGKSTFFKSSIASAWALLGGGNTDGDCPSAYAAEYVVRLLMELGDGTTYCRHKNNCDKLLLNW